MGQLNAQAVVYLWELFAAADNSNNEWVGGRVVSKMKSQNNEQKNSRNLENGKHGYGESLVGDLMVGIFVAEKCKCSRAKLLWRKI